MDQLANLPLVADRLNVSQSVLLLAPILAFFVLETFSRLLAPRASGVVSYTNGNRDPIAFRFLVSLGLAFGVGVLMVQLDPVIAIKANELFSMISGLIKSALIV
mgnify:FL=1